MKTDAVRKVKIDLVKDTWFVSFISRRRGQWHYAAQFYAPDHTLEWVKDWVRSQPGLILVKDGTK